MWFDDLILCKELQHKYELKTPIVDVGGLPRPCVADYSRSIAAMAKLQYDPRTPYGAEVSTPEKIRDAQLCRYLAIDRPLGFLGDYEIVNPELGSDHLPLERLSEKYDPARGTGIGTAILLSVLEHVADPFHAIDRLADAMAPGGLVIVSVPWTFPHHPQGGSGEDNFRFSPTGLRHVFGAWPDTPPRWEVLEADWRLDVPAEAGVLDMTKGRAQIIQSCYAVARAVGE